MAARGMLAVQAAPPAVLPRAVFVVEPPLEIHRAEVPERFPLLALRTLRRGNRCRLAHFRPEDTPGTFVVSAVAQPTPLLHVLLEEVKVWSVLLTLAVAEEKT